MIKREIYRAIHERAMRTDGFRIMLTGLAQDGDSEDRVPAPLKTLVSQTANDMNIVPTIMWALPEPVKAQIKYTPHL